MTQIKNITDKHKEFLYGQSLVQYKNISNIKISNGHDIFKMNIDTLLITQAKYEIEIVDEDKSKYKKFKIEYEPGHIYIPALNIKNASKKAGRIIAVIDKIISKDKDNQP